jgi:putative membrane protein
MTYDKEGQTPMRTPLKLLIAILACLLPLPAAASAGGGKGDWRGHGHAKTLAPISAQDFLTQAAQGNRFEIATGELAQQRGGSAEVRALGAMLVRDHTALQQQGDAVAAALGVTLPAGLDPKTQRAVDRLATLSGERFDRTWLKTQLWAHQKALALHLRGAIRGGDPQIRTLAQSALPAIAAHLGAVLDLKAGGRANHFGDRHGAKHGDKRGHHRGRGHDGRHSHEHGTKARR